MSDPARYRITSDEIEAIRRDGSVAHDLAIVDWMQRSRPHGEYRASAQTFVVRSVDGDAIPVGRTDWVARIGAHFVPCSGALFDALTQPGAQDPPVLCGECRDPFRPGELYPAPDGQELCGDCLLELELSQVSGRNTGSVVEERAAHRR